MALLTPNFHPPIFIPSMASDNLVGVAQAPRVQAIVSMLACQAWDALKFDTNKPQELKRYFLELEIHLHTASISNNQDRKAHAIQYLDIDNCNL